MDHLPHELGLQQLFLKYLDLVFRVNEPSLLLLLSSSFLHQESKSFFIVLAFIDIIEIFSMKIFLSVECSRPHVASMKQQYLMKKSHVDFRAERHALVCQLFFYFKAGLQTIIGRTKGGRIHTVTICNSFISSIRNLKNSDNSRGRI